MGRRRLPLPSIAVAAAVGQGATVAAAGARLGSTTNSNPCRRGPTGTTRGLGYSMPVPCGLATGILVLSSPASGLPRGAPAVRDATTARATTTVWGIPGSAGPTPPSSQRPLLQPGASAAAACAMGPDPTSRATLRPHAQRLLLWWRLAQRLLRWWRLVHGHRGYRSHDLLGW